MRRLLLSAWVILLASCGPPEMLTGDALEGRWVGDLESGLLPSGSSLVVVEIERAMAGEPVVATVVFGEGAPPSAPTDADTGWPAGIDPLAAGTVPVADGFEYPSAGGSVSGQRVRIDIPVTSLWAPWCALQSTYPTVAGTDDALCLPNRPWTVTPFQCQFDADESNPEEAVECLKLTLCRRAPVCDCTLDVGCEPSARKLTLYLEVNVTGNTAVGSFVWNIESGGGGTARVRLTRQ